PGRQPGQLAGRSPYLQAVHVETAGHAAAEIGRIVDLDITEALPNSLTGMWPAAAPRSGGAPLGHLDSAAAGASI
nr:hypothetical protein [Alphaproteobacteria bacterium]